MMSVSQFIEKFALPNLQTDRNLRCFIGRFGGESANGTEKLHHLEEQRFSLWLMHVGVSQIEKNIEKIFTGYIHNTPKNENVIVLFFYSPHYAKNNLNNKSFEFHS